MRYNRFDHDDPYHPSAPFDPNGDEDGRFVNEDLLGHEKFEIKWPEGYWFRCDELARKASKAAGDVPVMMVMRLDGGYHVHAIMRMGNRVQPVNGPRAGDRHAAWEAFIASLTTAPVKALTEMKPVKINMARAGASARLGRA